jgi:hypothetical protein
MSGFTDLSRSAFHVSVVRLACSACGAEANASCSCGKPYVPVTQRVADYDKTNPGKSERAAATDLGVSKTAVHEARESGGHQRPPEVTGRDGKTYSASKPPVAPILGPIGIAKIAKLVEAFRGLNEAERHECVLQLIAIQRQQGVEYF